VIVWANRGLITHVIVHVAYLSAHQRDGRGWVMSSLSHISKRRSTKPEVTGSNPVGRAIYFQQLTSILH